MTYKFVKWFNELGKNDVGLVGGKGANLGEVTNAKISVPPGFCVTAEAYKYFIEKTGLSSKIKDIIGKTDINNLEELMKNTSEIRNMITNTPMTPEIEKEIIEAYKELGGKDYPVKVAVRSSATAEDLPDASFAGQQETYLNVFGEKDLLVNVRRCWASLWTARATAYRQAQGFDHFSVYLSAVVQKMIQSEISGVAFTVNPMTGNRQEIMINASWGLGEAVVSGKVTPDEYIVDKSNLNIIEKTISDKNLMIVADPNSERGTIEIEVSKYLGEEFVKKQSLSDEQIVSLCQQLIKIEKHYGTPQDVEWGYENGNFYILQSRPITTLNKIQKEGKDTAATNTKKVLVKGLGASPGIATGKVVFVNNFDDVTKIEKNTILVTTMTNPDMVPAMKKSLAVVTDEGGRTCHAAIVSRELGIPCIVGTKNATEILKEGMEITVDASRGVVYEGHISLGSEDTEKSTIGTTPLVKGALWKEIAPVTATKIYMNLGEPEAIARYKDLPFDGIGLMRTEFIFTDHIGAHPMYLLKNHQEQMFIDKLAEGISTVAEAIYPRPVVVRFSDFRTNEFRGLKGGENEPIENNPMIGWRGVSRYISPEYEAGFRLECKAMRKVREEFQLTNVYAMLPFVRTTAEVRQVLKIMADEGLSSSLNFKVWIMAEVPSVVFLAEQFCTLVDGFSIGSNDLTQLILGADRDSEKLSNMGYLDERNEAVIAAISHLIETARKYGKTISICGQGPSVYPEFTEFLVHSGITSVSVNPDTVANTRRLVASVEQKMILESLRKLNK
ncbi:phosphoenolpyruvate synthase [Aceticella autotrophica]|uniref:Phosphoenolpyruvate synthase n=1 Tax=Aceticella autotrophica TaxID=2755338 RepID=A0A975GB26_9THEO|nr:phosphoenolpyruvate synthase [Aceticella autotrophica]QSZ27732.1 phosphoenolpyruvate synthase [Aceticella autotrophica]